MTDSRKIISFLVALFLFLFILFVDLFHLPLLSRKALACGAAMIALWVLEAMPMAAVALMPLVLFPLLGISTIEETALSYSNPVIFLFLGGFLLGLAIEKWNLHKRIALGIVQRTGTSGNRIILGFILSTAFLSMWLSNTATTMMLYPIAGSVITVMQRSGQASGKIANFSLCLMLTIAYASNIGGIATIIGTPPNVIFTSVIRKTYNYDIAFADWMLVCTPLALVLILLLYFVMTRWLYPNHLASTPEARELIRSEAAQLGKMSLQERRVTAVFLLTATLWITRDLINRNPFFALDDNMIAVFGSLLLFIISAGTAHPGKSLLEWEDTRSVAWGILLLFGGGIALAGALEKAGIIESVGKWVAGFSSGGGFLLILVITTISVFISEVMSNVTQVIVFTPVVTGIADALQMDPLLVGIPMTLAASCAFMLPMGTPPNAIVFASGHIKLSRMIRVGLVMNLISILLISLFCWLFLPKVMGVLRG